MGDVTPCSVPQAIIARFLNPDLGSYLHVKHEECQHHYPDLLLSAMPWVRPPGPLHADDLKAGSPLRRHLLGFPPAEGYIGADRALPTRAAGKVYRGAGNPYRSSQPRSLCRTAASIEQMPCASMGCIAGRAVA